MKSRDITPGKYAVKVDGQIVPATAIRRVKNHPRRWVIVVDESEGGTVKDRTTDVTSHAIIEPWDTYSTDTAHEAAIHEDRQREAHEAWEAERRDFAERAAPIIDAFRGIEVGSPIDGDLGEYLHKLFVEVGVHGTSFTFDTFEAVAHEIQRLRNALLDEQTGWTDETATDTGRPEVMVAEVNTPLATIEHLEARIAELDAQPPAGVSPEAMAELESEGDAHATSD